MGKTVAEKLLDEHLVEGRPEKGTEVGLRIDQTLTQDTTGTMVYLAFETLGLDRVKTELSVSYVDHSLLQTDHKNPDDHAYLQSAAGRFGLYFSRPGNGICHQVHLERFGRPGKTLLGADSHTPTSGGLGALAIGAGGLDVAAAMAGYPFYLTYPRILGVRLTGSLPDWVSARDVALELLRRLTVKGGVGYIVEFFGPGVTALDVPGRAVTANLCAELGATTTVWPSDENTRRFLAAEDREAFYQPLAADPDAVYDRILDLDLSSLEPLIALPSSPDNVVPVQEAAGREVRQVIIGSCANSSYRDLMTAAEILDGHGVHENVSLDINPGSRQVLENIMADGGLMKLVRAGARINQCGCLGCLGIGQAPATGAVSLRTVTRNFPGRSGTQNDQVFLCSPETAAAAALAGRITDPRELGKPPRIALPDRFLIDDQGLIPPRADTTGVVIRRGPNIKPFPNFPPMPDRFDGCVLLKAGDNVTTDDILPAGSQVLPFRSNIPAISRFVFQHLAPDFAGKAESAGAGAIVGGENYGQGSSREHAALAPRFLGVGVKLVRSFARIHRANLINFGVLPLTFIHASDYESVKAGEPFAIERVRELVLTGAEEIPVKIGGRTVAARLEASERERRILAAGGLLNLIRHRAGK
jgi:aconitate hydratase